MQYRPDIDGLRAVAVVAVVLQHAGLGFSGGFVGVDVFFVISGFLITGLMLKDFDAGKFSLVHFWERRIRRIVPALVVVVAASFVAGWFVLGPKTYASFAQSVGKLVLLQANVHFANFSGYFNENTAERPLLHSWSLAVEEQFYLVIPLVFLCAVRFGRRHLLGPLLGALAIASFAAAAYGVYAEDHAAYFQLTTRAWELLAGTAIAFRLHAGRLSDRAPLNQTVREALAALALAAIVVPCWTYTRHTPFPAPGALPPVLGAMLLIGLGADVARPTWVHRLLARRGFVGVGLVSYSLYLWHWPIFVFFKHYILRQPTIGERLLLVAASAAAAYLTYRFVETPFRRRDVLPGRWSSFAAAALALTAVHTGSKFVRSTDGAAFRLPSAAIELAATAVLDERARTSHLAADVPGNLTKLGAERGVPRLLVWGDSQCGSILSTIDRVCRAEGVSALAAVHRGWSPAVEHLATTAPGELSAARDFSEALIRHLRKGETRDVVLVAHWHRYASHPRFQPALLETVDQLQATGCRVFFMKEIPSFDYDIVSRLTQSAWHGGNLEAITCSRREYDETNDYYRDLIPELIARGAVILDPLTALEVEPGSDELRLCDADGLFLCDRTHLSVYGTKIMEPAFRQVAATVIAATPHTEPVRHPAGTPQTPIPILIGGRDDGRAMRR